MFLVCVSSVGTGLFSFIGSAISSFGWTISGGLWGTTCGGLFIGAEDTMVYMGYKDFRHMMEYYRTIRSEELLEELINKVINIE